MPPVVLEFTISARERPQIYALDRSATGTGVVHYYIDKLYREFLMKELCIFYYPGVPYFKSLYLFMLFRTLLWIIGAVQGFWRLLMASKQFSFSLHGPLSCNACIQINFAFLSKKDKVKFFVCTRGSLVTLGHF